MSKNLSKERVEELRESMRKSVYAGTLDPGDAENIAAILDDYAERLESPGPTARCPECRGTGVNNDAKQAWDIPDAPAPECSFCFGTGEVNAVPSPGPTDADEPKSAAELKEWITKFLHPVVSTEDMIQEFEQMTHECHERNNHICETCLGRAAHEAIRSRLAAPRVSVTREQARGIAWGVMSYLNILPTDELVSAVAEEEIMPRLRSIGVSVESGEEG